MNHEDKLQEEIYSLAAENEKLTAQVAVLRGYLLDVVELTNKGSQVYMVANAGLNHHKNKAEKMLDVVRAAEKFVPVWQHHCDLDPLGMNGLEDTRACYELADAVKAYKGE